MNQFFIAKAGTLISGLQGIFFRAEFFIANKFLKNIDEN